MPKKGSKPSPVAAAAAAAAKSVQSKAGAAAAPTAWLDNLDEEEREAEAKKKTERERKALQAQQEDVARNQAWEEKRKRAEKQQRHKDQQDAKWEREFRALVTKAKQEKVIVEAEEWEGGWWISESGLWKEMPDQFWCQVCDKKNLNEGNLEAHLQSNEHRKRREWFGQATPAPVMPAVGSSCAPATAAKAPPPAAASQCCAIAMRLEEWQEGLPDGSVRCIPCGKIWDELHNASEAHQKRLDYWHQQKELERTGYAAPPQEHLAWVLDDSCGERYMKCLLCNKWVQDDSSHAGTTQNPMGSKEHLKNLRNVNKADPWYRENVIKVREQWHPTRPKARPEAAAPKPSNYNAWAKQPPVSPPMPPPPPPGPPPPDDDESDIEV